MDLIQEVSDFGAPEFVCNGPASIEWISPHQVRITYYCRRKTGNVATHHTIYDIADLVAVHEIYNTMLPILMAESRTRHQLAVASAH